MKLNIIELPQEYTSKDTCYMRNAIPALFKKAIFKPNTSCVDYGGGRNDQTITFLAERQVTARVYDPYNRSEEYNNETIQWVAAQEGVDYVCCSNVLNVIKEEEVRQNVVNNIYKMLKRGGTAYFTTYEGNQSSIGKFTGRGWQNNRKTEIYLKEISLYFPTAKRTGILIIAQKD